MTDCPKGQKYSHLYYSICSRHRKLKPTTVATDDDAAAAAAADAAAAAADDDDDDDDDDDAGVANEDEDDYDNDNDDDRGDGMQAEMDDNASVSDCSQYSSASTDIPQIQREKMNRMLRDAKQSPIRSQTMTALSEKHDSTVRRLVSKLDRSTRALQGMLGMTVKI